MGNIKKSQMHRVIGKLKQTSQKKPMVNQFDIIAKVFHIIARLSEKMSYPYFINLSHPIKQGGMLQTPLVKEFKLVGA